MKKTLFLIPALLFGFGIDALAVPFITCPTKTNKTSLTLSHVLYDKQGVNELRCSYTNNTVIVCQTFGVIDRYWTAVPGYKNWVQCKASRTNPCPLRYPASNCRPSNDQ